MNDAELRALLAEVASGETTAADAAKKIEAGVLDDLGYAQIDHHRANRRGYPEAVFCSGKTPEQVGGIAASFRSAGAPALFTRADATHRDAIIGVLPDAVWHDDCGLAAWHPTAPERRGGTVTVVSAGTSDHRVAAEAAETARFYGRQVTRINDAGVAGLHRILRRLDDLEHADCLIVVAGMDGALPSVVAGLVESPVIAVPTSIGYGAAFEGIGPLLSMLSSCSPGVAVVNIDNGFGAGYLAAQITDG